MNPENDASLTHLLQAGSTSDSTFTCEFITG